MASSKEEDLYFIVDYPDNRKRITVTYSSDSNDNEQNENTICLVISNQIKTFSGLLSVLMNRFQIKTAIKSKLRLKTVDGRRVNDLSQLYNNQLLYLGISKLTSSNEFSEEIADTVKLAQEIEKIDQLELFTTDSNRNEFFKDIKKLKYNYPDFVVVGESFPYRCKIIFAADELRQVHFMYLVEPENYGSDIIRPADFVITSDSYISTGRFQREIEKIQEKDIVSFVTRSFAIYKAISSVVDTPVLDTRTSDIFPKNLKLQTTTSVGSFIQDKYQKINYLSKYLNTPVSLVRNLLFKSKWNFKQTFFEHDKLKVDGKICVTHKTKDIQYYKFNGLLEGQSQIVECSICYCEYDSRKEMVELLCGHRFCKECLSQYFATSIDEGNGNSIGICCPQIGCQNKVVDEVTIESLLPSVKSVKNITNFFNDIVFTSGAKWCPTADCERVFNPANKSPKDVLPFVKCTCNYSLCLYCGKNEFHWPLSCAFGGSESRSELENIEWMAKNATPCPSCKNVVEKNMGCNHMTCSICKNEFCYVCGQKYYGHTCVSMNETRKVNNFISQYLGNSPAVANYLETKRRSFKDQIATHLYNNLMLSIFVKRLGKISHIIEDYVLAVVNICGKGTYGATPEDSEYYLKQCRNNFLRIAMEVASKTKEVNPSSLYPQQIFDRSTVSLAANICLNGSKRVLIENQLVFSQFYQFKVEIAKQLKKNHNIDMDPTKMKIYNNHAAEIRSSNEIIFKEKVYICADKNEKFIEPEEYIEPYDEEEEENIKLLIGKTMQSFVVLDDKKKRKSNIETLKKKEEQKASLLEKLKIDQNQVVVEQQQPEQSPDEVSESDESSGEETTTKSGRGTLRVSSQHDMDIIENEINEMIKEFEDDESKQIEIINSVLEGYKSESLDFEQVYQICYHCKSSDEAFLAMSDYFDEKNHFKNYTINEKEIIVKEKIEALFPGLAQTIIYRAMDQNNSDLEASTSWILSKYSTLLQDFNNNIQFHNKKAIKKKNNNNNNNNNNKTSNSESNKTVAQTLQRTIQESFNSDQYDEDYEEEYDEYVEYDEYADNIKLHTNGKFNW